MSKENNDLSLSAELLLIILNAMDKAQKLTFPLLQALMKEAGVEATDSPRRVVELLIPLILQSKEIQMDVDESMWYVLFDVGIPAYLPDSWEKLEEMRSFNRESKGKGVHFFRSPLGSPPEIAKQWVGCQIPFSAEIAYPMVFVSSEMEAAGVTSKDSKCYVLDAPQAMECLRLQNPGGYKIVSELRPQWLENGQHLIFNGDACSLIRFEPNKAA